MVDFMWFKNFISSYMLLGSVFFWTFLFCRNTFCRVGGSWTNKQFVPFIMQQFPRFGPGTSRNPNLWSPIARHACDTARPAFPCIPIQAYRWWHSRTWNNFLHFIRQALVSSGWVRVNIKLKMLHGRWKYVENIIYQIW